MWVVIVGLIEHLMDDFRVFRIMQVVICDWVIRLFSSCCFEIFKWQTIQLKIVILRNRLTIFVVHCERYVLLICLQIKDWSKLIQFSFIFYTLFPKHFKKKVCKHKYYLKSSFDRIPTLNRMPSRPSLKAINQLKYILSLFNIVISVTFSISLFTVNIKKLYFREI